MVTQNTYSIESLHCNKFHLHSRKLVEFFSSPIIIERIDEEQIQNLESYTWYPTLQ